MKRWKRALGALLATVCVLSLTACSQESEQEQLPNEEIEEQLPQQNVPDEKPLEQADPVVSDQMLHRLQSDLSAPLSAVVRNGGNAAIKIELAEGLLEEIASFLCQNYKVLSASQQVDWKDSVYLQIIGQERIHDVYVTQWINEEGQEQTFVQVEENGMKGQYVYDPTTFGALREVLAVWEYENKVSLEGSYQLLTSQEYLEGLQSGFYHMDQLLQYGNNLVLGLSTGENSIFEVIDADSGDTIQTITTDKPVLDVRGTDLDGYDFYLLTADSVHYRSSADAGLKLDFQIPQAVEERIAHRDDLPMFDLDYINNELIYISEEGVVLSNQSGKRQDLLLPHQRLYSLLLLDQEDAPSDVRPYYAAPQLMNSGRAVVCPILLEGESKQWVGFSIFNLMNGTSKDYIFENIDSFRYPDDQHILMYDGQQMYEMDIITREIREQSWSSAVNESVWLSDMDQQLLWRKTMNYESVLLNRSLTTLEETPLLQVQGDRFVVYGVTRDYALVGWSDCEGDCMALVNRSPEKEETPQ